MQVLYITGYKAYEFGIFKNDHEAVQFIKKAIRQRLLPLVEEGLEWVIISGQLGTELWAAEVVDEMKDDYPNLKLGVLTPFLNQEEGWNETNQEYYRSVLAKADFVQSIFQKAYEGPYQLKAKTNFMIRKSEAILIVYDPEREGSPKFPYQEAIKKAEKEAYPIFQVGFDDLQQAAEEERWSDF